MYSEPSMDDIPSTILVDILSRLPVKTIIHCRCVCKKWQILLSDSSFANLHLSRSQKGLMIHHLSEDRACNGHPPGILKLVEIEDEFYHHQFHHDPVMSLDLDLGSVFQDSQVMLVGSVNGLICLWQYSGYDNTYICNPITREYMILPRQQYYRESQATIVYGFGFSSSTGQYKVVRIFEGDVPPIPGKHSRPSLLEGEIYTLGTGHWRSLGHIPYCLNGYHGPFLNGSVHWSVIDKDFPEEICAFDFENETFRLFPSPPERRVEAVGVHFGSLGVLNGCLSQNYCFNFSEFVIWMMKEYGIKESWSKMVVIRPNMNPNLDYMLWEPVYLIHGLKDGTILMVYYEDKLLAYCLETKTVEDTKIFNRYLDAMVYVPSFLSLGNFKSENVLAF